MLNIATGEMTYADNYEANRDVSYTINVSCETCLAGGPWSGSWGVSGSNFLVYGFDAGANVCANVVGLSDVLGATDASNEACADAGCDDVDADGICDDVDDCIGGELDECGVCNGDNACLCDPGDANSDGTVNVQDVVATVNYILEGGDDFAVDCADITGDGMINVLDVVAMVNLILEGRSADATSAKLEKSDNGLNLISDGYIGGVQITLSHGSDFSINLTDNAMVADYRTNGNSTTLIVVVPEGKELFTSSGDFEIEEVIIANSEGQIDVSFSDIPTSFSMGTAYPNPFNPTTTVVLSVPEDSYVSVKVYNLMGQLVQTLAEGQMEANVYSLTWNASDVPSGMYFVRAEAATNVVTQKLMLVK
jgi:hypothetical protein